jgi:hypothetical protein
MTNDLREWDVAGNTAIKAGDVLVRDSRGYVRPQESFGDKLPVVGTAVHDVDNSGRPDGGRRVCVRAQQSAG